MFEGREGPHQPHQTKDSRYANRKEAWRRGISGLRNIFCLTFFGGQESLTYWLLRSVGRRPRLGKKRNLFRSASAEGGFHLEHNRDYVLGLRVREREGEENTAGKTKRARAASRPSTTTWGTMNLEKRKRKRTGKKQL